MKLIAALTTAAAASLIAAGGASAETYCVAKPSCGGIVELHVQDALSAAAITPVPDRVEIGPGSSYSPDGFIYLGAGANNTVDVVGAGSDQTQLVGGSAVNGRPAVLLQGSAPAHISDLAIKTNNVPDPKWFTAGLKIFGTAERLDVHAGTRADGVDLLGGSTLKSSKVLVVDYAAGVASGDGDATIEDSSIDASNAGEGAEASGPGTLTVSHSTLTGQAGALAVNGGTLHIDNSLVLAGFAGLYAYDSAGTSAKLDGTNVTVIGTDPTVAGVESAAQGPGATTSVTLDNSVVAKTQRSLALLNAPGGAGHLTVRHSAYDHASAYEGGQGAVIDHSQPNLDITTPGFVDPAAGNFRLAADSPLRDAADPAPTAGLAATDLAGNPRSVDGNGDGTAAPDIGAYEFQPPAAPATPPPTPVTPPSPPQPPVVAADPPVRILSAKLTHRRFAVRKRATAFRIKLSKDARVKIKIRRGKLTRAAHRGNNRIAFSGRIAKRALKPGRYVATVTATDAAGHRSKPRRLPFTVVKR